MLHGLRTLSSMLYSDDNNNSTNPRILRTYGCRSFFEDGGQRGKEEHGRRGSRNASELCSSCEITLKSDSVDRQRERGICNVCNVTRRCHLCPWLFVRTPCERKRIGIRARSIGTAYFRLASDAARAIKRARTTSSAPALITARRRSYFTPRSSIIHAVNNAPLFRVTLYRGSPSFLPCPSLTFCEDKG